MSGKCHAGVGALRAELQELEVPEHLVPEVLVPVHRPVASAFPKLLEHRLVHREIAHEGTRDRVRRVERSSKSWDLWQ